MFPVLARIGPFGVLRAPVRPVHPSHLRMLVALGFLAALVVVLRGPGARTPLGTGARPGVRRGAHRDHRLPPALRPFQRAGVPRRPLSIFKVWEGGLVFHGGLFLAIPACLYFRAPLRPARLADGGRFRPGHRARSGHWPHRLLYRRVLLRRPLDPPFCVTFTDPEALAPLNVPLFPAQLSHSPRVVVAVLVRLPPRVCVPGSSSGSLWSWPRSPASLEDSFRGGAKLELLPWLSATQAISLGLAAFALLMFVLFGRRSTRLTLPR